MKVQFNKAVNMVFSEPVENYIVIGEAQSLAPTFHGLLNLIVAETNGLRIAGATEVSIRTATSCRELALSKSILDPSPLLCPLETALLTH